MKYINTSKIYSLEEIGKLIEGKNVKCRWCKEPLKAEDVRSYSHEGGVTVKGFEKNQWVYFHCKKCRYDWALWKILK